MTRSYITEGEMQAIRLDAERYRFLSSDKCDYPTALYIIQHRKELFDQYTDNAMEKYAAKKSCTKERAAELVNLYAKHNMENDNVVAMLTQLADEIRKL